MSEFLTVGSDIPAALSSDNCKLSSRQKVDHEYLDETVHAGEQKGRPLLDLQAANEACGYELSFLVSKTFSGLW